MQVKFAVLALPQSRFVSLTPPCLNLAGKTTYCSGMKMFITELGRKCEVVNLDFANDALPYTPAVDVRDLISLQVLVSITFPNGFRHFTSNPVH